MSYILGLDLGANSIGWALINESDQQIPSLGVRIFPEGVDRDQTGGEVSKNETRRTARMIRRSIQRRSFRKRNLRKALLKAGLLTPETNHAVDSLNPYALRAKALDHPLELHELARVLIHLNQRRGFKSSRKSGKSKEDKGMLKEIADLQAEIDASGKRTLGEYLNSLYEQHGPSIRIRHKHTRRSMFEHEFNLIWEKQKTFHPSILTDELRQLLWDRLIAYQRAIRWRKSTVGRCELIPKERRCPKSHRLAERFRLLHEINNLRIYDQHAKPVEITPDQRQSLLNYLADAKERDFDQLRKHLKLSDQYNFNLEAGGRNKLPGCATDYTLKKLFKSSKCDWLSLPENHKNLIVELILDESIEEDAFREKIAALNLPPSLVDELVQLDLPQGYASYSKAAIEKLLPFMEEGLPLSGTPGQPDALHLAGFLRPDEKVPNQRDFLPTPPDIANPLVRQALFQLRRLVNAIIKEHGKPSAIHIELAREVRGSAKQRAERSLEMRDRERRRKTAADHIIREVGISPKKSDIDKYLLWDEQEHRCLYSDREISLKQLYSSGDIDIDHILPYSRSLDDSLLNKAIVFRSENHLKGNRTPYEWLADTDFEKYARILQNASRLPLDVRNAKRQRIATEAIVLDDFINRQLTDTQYISRLAAQYIQCLGVDVVCSKGQCTSELRHQWGLDAILRDDGLNLKNREDHRHHAVDAAVIALANRSRLQTLARVRYTDQQLPRPWENFRDDLQKSVNAINVSHRPRRKISGQLHEETHYGPTAKPWLKNPIPKLNRPHAKGWIEDPQRFAYRKPLVSLTLNEVTQIRDETVKQIVLNRLKEHGIIPGQTDIPINKKIWEKPLRFPTQNGAVIKKVRLTKMDQTILPIRDGRSCVKTGSNHHVCIFEFTEKGKIKREAIWCSRLEASNRLRNHQPVIQRTHPTKPDARFIMSLCPGDMVLGKFKGEERLAVFITGASTQGQMYFSMHTDSRPGNQKKKFAVMANTLDAHKVTVDLLGRIRWADKPK